MKQRTSPGAARDAKPSYASVARDPAWDTFAGFCADMAASWFEGAVLARFGDKGDYTPTNARWVTKSENAREGNEPRMLRMPDGRLAADVARANGIGRSAFAMRIHYGWSVDDAATRKVR
jgi:hypothetical protein